MRLGIGNGGCGESQYAYVIHPHRELEPRLICVAGKAARLLNYGAEIPLVCSLILLFLPFSDRLPVLSTAQ